MAANTDLNIFLKLKDNASKKFQKFAKVAKKSLLVIAAAIAAAVFAFKKMATALIETSAAIEQMKVTLTVLLKDVKLGNQLFADMAKFAGQVPKTYEEIMEATTALTGVVRNGAEDVKQLMPIIVDISSAIGLSVMDVTSQIIKMYAAGASAADMFRDRGISAALGFQAKVQISAEETMNVIVKQWEDGTGKFVGASELLAKAFVGQVSMMQDAWFQFKRDVGVDLFESVKIDMAAVLAVIQESKEEGGEYADVVKELSKGFDDAFEASKRLAFSIAVGMGQGIDIFNELRFGLAAYNSLIQTAAIGNQKLAIALIEVATAGLANTEGLQETLALMEEQLQESLEKEIELRAIADEDYSISLENRLLAFEAAVEKQKELIKKQVDNTKAGAKREEEAERKRAAVIAKIRDAEVKTREVAFKKNMSVTLETSNNLLGMLAQTLDMAQGETKKFAGVLKVVRIGETIINTATAVMRAMADVPYPLNTGVAAMIAAMGAAQVGIIASQGFARGTDTVPARLSPGEMVFPSTMADAIRRGDIVVSGRGGFRDQVAQNQAQGDTIISFEFNDTVVRDREDIEEIVNMVSRALVEEAERI